MDPAEGDQMPEFICTVIGGFIAPVEMARAALMAATQSMGSMSPQVTVGLGMAGLTCTGVGLGLRDGWLGPGLPHDATRVVATASTPRLRNIYSRRSRALACSVAAPRIMRGQRSALCTRVAVAVDLVHRCTRAVPDRVGRNMELAVGR